jgi:diguanylate cyclase (GGDEF)-like protein
MDEDQSRPIVVLRQPAAPQTHFSFAIELVQSMVVPTFVIDHEGIVRIWNRACEKLTGVPASEVIGTRDHWRGFYENARPCLCDLVLNDRLDEFETFYAARALSQDHSFGVHAENWCVMPRLGHNLYLALDAGAIFDAEGRLVAVVETLRDMTEQQQAQSELARLASQDSLTGLANRRAFDERLAFEWSRAQRDGTSLALLMLDVDRFKEFNDSLGHPAGDACLRTIARALGGAMGRATDLVARYGGEEFAVILPQTNLRGAGKVAERLRAAVEDRRIDRAEGVVTVSVGGSWARPDREGLPEALLDLADQALYQAKHDGRNRVVTRELACAPARASTDRSSSAS